MQFEPVIKQGGIMGLPFPVTQVFWMIAKVWFKHNLLILQGGTSSSKTYSILQFLIIIARIRQVRITIVGQDIPNLKVGAFRDFQTIIKSSKLVESWFTTKLKGERYYEMDNGSFFEFKSYDDAQDAKSGKRDILFVNEINGIDPEVFNELNDRTTWRTICDYNPSGRFWVHDDLIGKEGSVLLISNFLHNRFCDKNIVKKLLSYRKTNKYRWRVYGLGLTGQVEGTIFPDCEIYGPQQYADVWPGDDNLQHFGYGSDYGFAEDPLTLIKAGLYQGKIYVKAMFYKTATNLPDFVKVLKAENVDPYDIISFDDSQAKEQAWLLEHKHGYNIKAANRKGGSILSGIGLLENYPIVIVDDDDGNFSNEQKNYKWLKKHGKFIRKPIDKHNHYWDSLRYWALEMLTMDGEEYEGNYGAV